MKDDTFYIDTIASLQSEIDRLKNDLLDALDLKEGNGPTALSMLKKEIDRLKTELSEMKKEREELRNKVIEEVMAICEKAGGTISAHYLEKALRIKK